MSQGSEAQARRLIPSRTRRTLAGRQAENIKKELDALRFPLYFFDYEAFGPAIPAFNGYCPYKQIPFQFSLHILRGPDAPLEHVEFLHDTLSDPSGEVVELLRQHVPTGGTVIAWFKHFETMVNKEMGTRLPEHAEFLEDFNRRIYDPMDIFHDQHYVHHGFRGKCSIKKILPTLDAELRYDGLDIQEGGQAANSGVVVPARSLYAPIHSAAAVLS